MSIDPNGYYSDDFGAEKEAAIRADQDLITTAKIARWLVVQVPSSDAFAPVFDRLALGIRNGEYDTEDI
jgi:hypothetical protein